MKTIKKIMLLILVFTAIYACSSDDDNFIAPPQLIDQGFDGSIEDIREFYNDSLVNALENLGFVIHTGNTPPNLEGSFLFSPEILKKSTVPGDVIGRRFPDYLASFSNQDNTTLTIDFSGVGGDEVDNGDGSFISGKNNNFSIFLKLKSQIGSYQVVDTAFAISGIVVENGLKDIQVIALMLDDKGDPQGIYIGNNEGRLFIDSDFFSPKQ